MLVMHLYRDYIAIVKSNSLPNKIEISNARSGSRTVLYIAAYTCKSRETNGGGYLAGVEKGSVGRRARCGDKKK